MSREVTFRYLTASKIKDVLCPEITNSSRRIESLIDQIIEGKHPENHAAYMDEIKDACVNIRCCAEAVQR